MTFKEFQTKWLGKRVDTDGYPPKAIYQCVDLAKQGLKEMHGIPYGAYGDAVAYWYRTASVILKKFDKVASSAAKEGDVVILKGINGNAAGHIGWGTGRSLPGYIQILEQNGATGNGSGTGGDAIRTRYVPRTRVLGLLRKKVSALYHTVVLGDTLGYIAKKYGTTVAKLVELNKSTYPSLSTNPNYIKVGWKLKIK